MATINTRQQKWQLILGLTLVFGIIAGTIAGLDSRRGHDHGGHGHGLGPGEHGGYPTVPPCGADNSECETNACCCSNLCKLKPSMKPKSDSSWSSGWSSEVYSKKFCMPNCTSLEKQCMNASQCCPTNSPINTTAICSSGVCAKCRNVTESCNVSSDCCNTTSPNTANICSAGKCAPLPPQCIARGEPCSTGSDPCCGFDRCSVSVQIVDVGDVIVDQAPKCQLPCSANDFTNCTGQTNGNNTVVCCGTASFVDCSQSEDDPEKYTCFGTDYYYG